MPETTNARVQSSVFDDILYQFEKDYRAGKNPEPKAYLTGEGENRWRLLLELLHSNLELRLRAGETLYVKDYLQKYPDLAQRPGDILSLLAVELRFLNEQGQKPVLEEYEQNYGKLIPSSLKSLFEQPSPKQTDYNLGKLIANRYRLIKVLGQGGMGTVYLAEQSEPVKRQVALKLIRTGVDSRQYITRFEAERQALAVMDHPNIARVYDGGTTELHQPYFVMELVQGTPITQYCDKHRHSPKVRLELFVLICQAVQHAHQKGIIHRDLKPGNVLVTEVDGKPVPKVIDFGLAKATEQPLTDETIEEQGIVGTPAYMSPEQADPDNQDVDTRTDVYALGVILYELLTGSTPIEARQFRRGAVLEMLRMVREEEPPRPSTKLSSAEELPSIAANRDVEPKQLLAWVRGDIEWIVMKSLEKDRNRRYETANGFAADVQRYLCGEPVLAHPPSSGYRLLKFIKRNQTQVIAAGLVVAALVVGLGVSLWQMNRAIKAEFATAEQLKLTDAARADAEEKLAFLKKSNEILGSVFAGLDPKANYATVAEFRSALKKYLEKAVIELEGTKIGDPLSVAQLQKILGLSLLGMGDAPKAILLLEKGLETRKAKLGQDHPDTIRNLNNLATGYMDNNQYEKAVLHFKKAMDVNKTVLANDIDAITNLINIAECYRQLGKLKEALPLLQEAYSIRKNTLGQSHSETLISLHNLAAGYLDDGQLNLALPLLEESYKLRKSKYGTNNLDTFSSMNSLAEGYRRNGQLTKAIPLLEECLNYRKVNLGPDHPSTLTSMNNLALAYKDSTKLEKAIILYQESLEISKTKLGANHSDTLNLMNNLGMAYLRNNQFDKALPLLEETHIRRTTKFGKQHPDTLTSLNNLALGFLRTGKPEISLPLFDEALKLLEKNSGRKHPHTLTTLANLGINYKEVGRLAEAIPLLEEAYRSSTKNPALNNMASHLVDAYAMADKKEEVTKLVTVLLADARRTLPKDGSEFADNLGTLGNAFLKCGVFSDAEPLLRECLSIREKRVPDSWTTFNTMSMLGGSLLGQKKYAEAEPLLLKGYEGMKKHETTIPPQVKIYLPIALDRLIQLYTETNKPEELKKWQAERAKYPTKPNEIKK